MLKAGELEQELQGLEVPPSPPLPSGQSDLVVANNGVARLQRELFASGPGPGQPVGPGSALRLGQGRPLAERQALGRPRHGLLSCA